MSVKTFVDTNILLYAYHRDAGNKHEKAKAVLAELWENNNGTISAQVLQEFYVNLTRKVASPLSPKEAMELVAQFLHWEVIPIQGGMVTEAAALGEKYKINFWDAMIVVAAQRTGSKIILSEDLQSGMKFEGVVVQNPFTSGDLKSF